MKLMSWNVNGIRAVSKKVDLATIIKDFDLDALCLQEVKAEQDQFSLELPGYQCFWNAALNKKGYSGTAIYIKTPVISATYGINHHHHDQEGRVITLELDSYYLVNVYTPNSKDGLLRLDYRVTWEHSFREYLNQLAKHKPIILCGDLNVAHQEIDLTNPEQNHLSPGFSDEERACFGMLLESGFIDTYRYLFPDKIKYSWWSYRTFARERNVGWRIDYFLVSKTLQNKIIHAEIINEIEGSDHCPVFLELA